MRRWIVEMRALALAIVTAPIGAALAHGYWLLLTPEYERENHPVRGLMFAIAGALSTGMLARWAGRRDERAVWRDVSPTALAGALNAPAMMISIALAMCIEMRSLGPLLGSAVACVAATIFGGPIGLFLGHALGAGHRPLRRALDALARAPDLTSMPRAWAAAGAWSAGGLGVTMVLAAWSDDLRYAALLLAGSAVVVAASATLIAYRRRVFAKRAERGELDGWRVEHDEDGTRWLVREERGGDGAYREGVMSRRWARV